MPLPRPRAAWRRYVAPAAVAAALLLGAVGIVARAGLLDALFGPSGRPSPEVAQRTTPSPRDPFAPLPPREPLPPPTLAPAPGHPAPSPVAPSPARSPEPSPSPSLSPDSAPPEVIAKLDLLENLELLENLDLLEASESPEDPTQGLEEEHG